MKLDIPESVVLPDGTTGIVRGIAAKVIDGRVDSVVYTVEKASGAWTDVTASDEATIQPEVNP